jgi:hypothetical protein
MAWIRTEGGRFHVGVRPFDGGFEGGSDIVFVDFDELLIEEIRVGPFPFHGRIISPD